MAIAVGIVLALALLRPGSTQPELEAAEGDAALLTNLELERQAA